MIAKKTTAVISTDFEITNHAPVQQVLTVKSFARRYAMLTAVTILSASQAFADQDDRNQQILPFQTITASTIPSNGDVNPYGVAFVPRNFPAGGLLNPDDLLVSNFNNNQNIQGTGTTIIKITPTGQTSLFFQVPSALRSNATFGLSTGLAVLKAGFVLVANCPTNNLPPVPGALPGSLLLIDSNGNLVETITNAVIQGPWDFTVQDEGKRVKVFVSNVVNGTVSRLDLALDGNMFDVRSVAVIGSLYTHRVDPATFEVGPTGLAYNEARDILYVA